MKKKSAKKSTHNKHISQSLVYIRYASLALMAVAVVLAGKGFLSATSRIHVLGVQTGPVLLADHGGDDSAGESSGAGSSGGTSNSSGGGNNSGSSPNIGDSQNPGSSGGSGSSQTSISNNTQVDCVGPDGNHFTTDFKSCSDLNNAWHHSNFSFTPLNTFQQSPEQENEAKPTPEQFKQQNPNQGKPNELRVKTEDGKARIDLIQNGIKVNIEQEGDKVKIKAEKPDGTEIELETKNTLDVLNKELETEGVEIATTDANTIAIKKNGVEAETEFPIGVDPVSHELTITTPAGIKTVTVLPDQAVNNLLENKLLTSITSQTSSISGTTQNVNLTEVNNEATFEVQGVLQKRILGIIPVGFAKTEFVSTQTGNVVKTDETLLNRILEALSF